MVDKVNCLYIKFNIDMPMHIIVSLLIVISRGEICVANFIPPANGVSLGSFFVFKI